MRWSPGFTAVQNDVIVADGIADGQAFLTRDSTSSVLHRQEDKEASADSSYRQNWNDWALVIAPDNLRAHLLGHAQLAV